MSRSSKTIFRNIDIYKLAQQPAAEQGIGAPNLNKLKPFTATMLTALKTISSKLATLSIELDEDQYSVISKKFDTYVKIYKLLNKLDKDSKFSDLKSALDALNDPASDNLISGATDIAGLLKKLPNLTTEIQRVSQNPKVVVAPGAKPAEAGKPAETKPAEPAKAAEPARAAPFSIDNVNSNNVKFVLETIDGLSAYRFFKMQINKLEDSDWWKNQNVKDSLVIYLKSRLAENATDFEVLLNNQASINYDGKNINLKDFFTSTPMYKAITAIDTQLNSALSEYGIESFASIPTIKLYPTLGVKGN